MALEFGQQVKMEAEELQKSGIDPNQIANIVWKKDKQGHNYGIGIILNERGHAMPTSATLLHYAKDEVDKSTSGDYMNSNAILASVLKSVLLWQRIPETYWDRFKLILPSDAGTGSLLTAIQTILMMRKDVTALGVEELGWPAYKALAKVNRLGIKEFPADGVIAENGVLPVYQSGPMNTTGQVRGIEVIKERAKKAAQDGTVVLLDRAYSGFEFARDIITHRYEEIMKKSFELQLLPFLEAGVTTLIAISPTKAFFTFSLRPCGFLLLFNPAPAKDDEITTHLNTASRARGSSFEHAITRGFAKGFVRELPKFEREHEWSLRRLANVEFQWKSLVKGTPIEYIFSDNYAGLFRNPKASPDAPENIYNEHLYPVFSSGRCRVNATGLPGDKGIAEKHVAVFAKHCS